MSQNAFEAWMDSVSTVGWYWYVKRLSGNDTLATGGHQAGPYIPKKILFDLFPSLNNSRTANPRVEFPVAILPSGHERTVTAIWYNNKVSGTGTRDECRVTNWGGSGSPLLDPDATGSLCVFAFYKNKGRDSEACKIWLCQTPNEEDAVTNRIGPVEPGETVFLVHDGIPSVEAPVSVEPVASKCRLSGDEIPEIWKKAFPSTTEVFEKVLSLIDVSHKRPDQRLILRRNCEYDLFRSVEEILVLPVLKKGFESIEKFLEFANSVTNRRKSRSGMSLERHLKAIFGEESLHFSYQAVSEGTKTPDFLFPSVEAYRDAKWPDSRLRMLAAKTTCKERWQQILNEADRIPCKHLITLQEGVSVNQYKEMEKAEIILVVPAELHTKYPVEIRSNLLSLASFIAETKSACQ